jgi:hypothetical protein
MYKEYYHGTKEYYEYDENGMIIHDRTVFGKHTSSRLLNGSISIDHWYGYTCDGDEYLTKEVKEGVDGLYTVEYDPHENPIREHFITNGDDIPYEVFTEYDREDREAHRMVFSPDKATGHLDQEDWFEYDDNGGCYNKTHVYHGNDTGISETWYDKNGDAIRHKSHTI